MYAAITGTGNNKSVYIMQSFRKDDGRTSSRVYRKLGKLNDLLDQFCGDKNQLMNWAKTEAAKDTAEYKDKYRSISISLSRTAFIPKDQERCFPVGYLFLQKICAELMIDSIFRKIKTRHKFSYDLSAIFTDLLYARILNPASKRSSYSYCMTLPEPPKYSLENVYRSLSVLSEESDFIQEELYKNSNFIHPRKNKILYYDCTNYYFEIEKDDEFRKYGKSKENRPNPIVTMGLFMDADGVPLAFDMFPGNQNEQTTLKPLESKIIHDFGCSEFIFCSDAGLGSMANRRFNSLSNRAYVITHSLKKMRKEDRDCALNPKGFKLPGSEKTIDIRALDETDETVFHSVYYKEMPLITGKTEETVIVTYSPKYKDYQRRIRDKQIERAKKMIENPCRKRKGKNQNDPARFVKKTTCTNDGEIAQNAVYSLDQDKIDEEAMYDGFYAVVTNLEGDVSEIIRINKNRWEIEENFRIMKTEFEARPVYVRREDRIQAHFLTCFTSLLIYRLLEKKLGTDYTCETILQTLRAMNLTKISEDSGYVPSYKRTDLTDLLHEIFGFRTDYEFIPKASLRSIIKESKIKK